jgi:hypothetical protein
MSHGISRGSESLAHNDSRVMDSLSSAGCHSLNGETSSALIVRTRLDAGNCIR